MDVIKFIAATALITIIVAFGTVLGVLNFATVNVTVQVPPTNSVGAFSSPDLQSPWFGFGGVRQWAGSMSMRTASTSLCSIQSPAATTTLVAATAYVTGGNTYANDYQLGFGIAQGATTTNLARLSIGANAAGVAIATSTNLVQSFGNGGKDGQIPPNTWINFNVSTTSASSLYAPTGQCYAVFREV